MTEPRVATEREAFERAAATAPPGARAPVEVRVSVADPFDAYRRARDGTGGFHLETTGGQSGWGYFGVDPVNRLTVWPDDVDDARAGESTSIRALVDRLDAIVVSPGPGTPREAGVSMPIFRELAYPTLGVCLGHQALCAVNGAAVGHAEAVVHGKQSAVSHNSRGVFAALPDGVQVGRYHSLAVDHANVPEVLEETAHTDDEADVVMGVRHRERPHVGVQFHPESILTEHGKQLIATFCRLALEGSL
jgi:anthranilate synthase component 2